MFRRLRVLTRHAQPGIAIPPIRSSMDIVSIDPLIPRTGNTAMIQLLSFRFLRGLPAWLRPVIL